jgi:hypothetical protein
VEIRKSGKCKVEVEGDNSGTHEPIELDRIYRIPGIDEERLMKRESGTHELRKVRNNG